MALLLQRFGISLQARGGPQVKPEQATDEWLLSRQTLCLDAPMPGDSR